MRLVVIADTSQLPQPADEHTWVLHLRGITPDSEIPPPDIRRLAEKACQRVRARFPLWLWNCAKANDALALATWPGPISWWWYAPLSEMSPLRSPFIREIYWITLLDLLLDQHQIESIEWRGDDALIAEAAACVSRQHQIPFNSILKSGDWKRGRFYRLAHRLWYSCCQLCIGILLRLQPRQTSLEKIDIAFYTRYPVLWSGDRERMFGTLPEFLQEKGHRLLYAAVYSEGILSLLRNLAPLRSFGRTQKLVFLESFVSLKRSVACHFPLRFFSRFWTWRQAHRKEAISYDGIDVTDLWWRQLDSDVLNPEIPFDLTLSEAWRELADKAPALRTVYFPFEFQTMERATSSGLNQKPGIHTVGLQTGLYTSNQMGFSFAKSAVRTDRLDAAFAPLPDVLAAYGPLAYRVLSERLGAQRVCLSGPVRYPATLTPQTREDFIKEHGLPNNAVFLFVATPAMEEEASSILKGAFQILDQFPDLFLLIKFHYHLPLQAELERLGNGLKGEKRYKQVDGDAQTYMQASAFMMTGSSSIGIEAMTVGCMPVVYQPIGDMPCNPMLDVPGSAFLWSTFPELQGAVASCLQKSKDYEQRKDAWPKAIGAHMADTGTPANTLLYNFIQALS